MRAALKALKAGVIASSEVATWLLELGGVLKLAEIVERKVEGNLEGV